MHDKGEIEGERVGGRKVETVSFFLLREKEGEREREKKEGGATCLESSSNGTQETGDLSRTRRI